MAFLPQNEMPVSSERKDHESVTGVPENTGQLRGKSVFVDRADAAAANRRRYQRYHLGENKENGSQHPGILSATASNIF